MKSKLIAGIILVILSLSITVPVSAQTYRPQRPTRYDRQGNVRTINQADTQTFYADEDGNLSTTPNHPPVEANATPHPRRSPGSASSESNNAGSGSGSGSARRSGR